MVSSIEADDISLHEASQGLRSGQLLFQGLMLSQRRRQRTSRQAQTQFRLLLAVSKAYPFAVRALRNRLAGSASFRFTGSLEGGPAFSTFKGEKPFSAPLFYAYIRPGTAFQRGLATVS